MLDEMTWSHGIAHPTTASEAWFIASWRRRCNRSYKSDAVCNRRAASAFKPSRLDA